MTGYVPRRLGACLNNCYNNGVPIQDCTFRLQARILNRAGQEIAPLETGRPSMFLIGFNPVFRATYQPEFRDAMSSV